MRRPPSWLESAVDQLDVPLLLVGADRSITYANLAAHRLFGLPFGHLEGMAAERLVVPERRGELRNLDDVLAGGAARRVRSMVRRDDGHRLDVTMQIEPCLDEAGQVGAVSIRYEVVAAAGRPTMGPGPHYAPSHPPERPSLAPHLSVPPRPVTPSQPSSPVAQGPTAPPPRHSERRLVATRASELKARLQRIFRNLQWLEERLSVPSSVAPLDDARERARAMLVVSESRGLVHESLDELEEERLNADIPAAPKLPKV